MRLRHNVMTDSAGAVHITAERRFLLYELCNRLGLDRRAIRWNMDLRCHALIVQQPKDKQALRQLLQSTDKGVKPCSQRSDSPPYSPFGSSDPGAAPRRTGDLIPDARSASAS